MGLLDKFKKNADELTDKAKGMVHDHNDKVDDGIDKGGDAIDKKTGGKHSDHIDKGVDTAQERLDTFGDGPAKS